LYTTDHTLVDTAVHNSVEAEESGKPDTDYAAVASLDLALAEMVHIDMRREAVEGETPMVVGAAVGVGTDIDAEKVEAEGKIVVVEEAPAAVAEHMIAAVEGVVEQAAVAAKPH
jgi:ribosomal protein L10